MRGRCILGGFFLFFGGFLSNDVFCLCLVFIKVHARIPVVYLCVCMYVFHVCSLWLFIQIPENRFLLVKI